jgi:tetratricopeptide (TPR) repeat protein
MPPAAPGPGAVPPRPRGAAPRRLLALALAALVVAAYLPSLGNGFVWDDEAYVRDNPRVAGGLTPGNLAWAFTTFHEANWHPLAWVSHQVDAQLFGLRPPGHHLASVLLHAANAVLLFALLARLTGATWGSLLVAALFGVHPLHVESAGWVAERKDVLSAFFALLAALAYARHVARPSPRRLGAVAALFAAALLAKPMPVTLPFVLLLLDLWPLGRFRSTPAARLLLEKAPLLALAAVSSAITWNAQSSGRAVNAFYPTALRVGNALVGYVRYLGKTLWPSRLAVFYPHPAHVPAAQAAGALLLLAALTAAAALAWRRRPALIVGWLWFLGMLVPMSGLVQVGSHAIADRYTYLPQVGLCVAAVFGLGGGVRRGAPARAAAAAVAVAVVGVLAALTVRQELFWRDAGTLFEHALAVTADNSVAHEQLGIWYQAHGENARAEAHDREALRLQPLDAVSRNNLGAIQFEAGRYAEAAESFEAAARCDPAIAKPFFNAARALTRLGRRAEAAAWYRQGLAVDRGDADAHLNLGALLVELGRPDEAVAEFSESARLDPASADAHANLGVVLAAQGRYAAAVEQFGEAVRLRPDDPELRASLSRAVELARSQGRRP